MERRIEELVAEIRAKRGRTLHDLRELTPIRELERRVREAPLQWTLGSAVAGLLATRFLAPSLVRRGREHASGWMRSRLRSAVAAAVVAATARSRSKGASEPEKTHAGT